MKHRRGTAAILMALAILLTPGAAPAEEDNNRGLLMQDPAAQQRVSDEEIGSIAVLTDPDRRKPLDILKPVNYLFYWINDPFARYLAKPLAIGYSYVIPRPARHGINNFFNNIVTPFSSLNNLLQGKVGDSGTEIARFGINTTAGVLGFYDFADKKMDIEAKPEDLGQTFGKWGLHEGPYFMLPIIGPTTLRDLPSTFTMRRDGVEWYRGEKLEPIRYASGVGIITLNGLSLTYGAYDESRELAEEAGVRHYEFIRDHVVDVRYRKTEDMAPRN